MGALESAVRGVMDAFDRQEYDVLRESLAPDAQGVDEISRRWLRDAGEIDAYFKQLEGVATGISSEVSELREEDWGDVGGPIADFQPPADGYVSGEPWQAVAPLRYFNDRAGSIYAGSNEIQRNILAKAELGL